MAFLCIFLHYNSQQGQAIICIIFHVSLHTVFKKSILPHSFFKYSIILKVIKKWTKNVNESAMHSIFLDTFAYLFIYAIYMMLCLHQFIFGNVSAAAGGRGGCIESLRIWSYCLIILLVIPLKSPRSVNQPPSPVLLDLDLTV